MKVIEPGQTNPVIGRFSCTGNGNDGGGCGALLEVSKDDLRFYPGSEYPIARAPAVTFKCPMCSELTDLKIHDWPVKADRKLKKFSEGWEDPNTEEPNEFIRRLSQTPIYHTRVDSSED